MVTDPIIRDRRRKEFLLDQSDKLRNSLEQAAHSPKSDLEST